MATVGQPGRLVLRKGCGDWPARGEVGLDARRDRDLVEIDPFLVVKLHAGRAQSLDSLEKPREVSGDGQRVQALHLPAVAAGNSVPDHPPVA